MSPRRTPPTFRGGNQWDAHNYLRLAEVGYVRSSPSPHANDPLNIVYLPFFPLAVHIVSRAVQNLVLSALVVSLTASMGAGRAWVARVLWFGRGCRAAFSQGTQVVVSDLGQDVRAALVGADGASGLVGRQQGVGHGLGPELPEGVGIAECAKVSQEMSFMPTSGLCRCPARRPC